MIDNRLAAREAVEHLIATGRRRIALIGAERHPNGSSSQRLAGFYDAMLGAGVEIDTSLIAYVERFNRTSGWSAMQQLLERPDPPDAVFAFSDPMALGGMRALHERGVRIPDDIAVVGFDDIEDGRFSMPTLTTISPDHRYIARTALDRAEARIGGATDPPAVLIAPHHLEIRESTTLRTQDRPLGGPPGASPW